jgi:DNA-binding response OmpR family regulator
MGKKIMVVDDDEDIRYTIQHAMEFYNPDIEVILVEGGEQCFQLLENGTNPDIILLDIMMPGMDGFTVFDRLKSRESSFNTIPIVFLTAKKDKHSVDVGQLFAEDYIEKPFEFDDLVKRIEAVLNKSKDQNTTQDSD